LFRPLILVCLSAGALWAQTSDFQKTLYPVLEKANCRACHNSEGVASATRLHFPEAGSSDEKIAAFGNSLVVLVDRDHPEASLLFKKPTARIPHTGGERIKPGSPEEVILKNWIARLAQLQGPELAAALKYRELENAGTGAASEDAELRRLTHSQYNHTVRDLLGDQTSPAAQFPPEDFVNGFRNQSRGQSLSPLLVEAYSDAAEKVARSAFRGGDTHNLIPCKPSVACRARFVREFGRKAFRRPLNVSEQQRYETLIAHETDFMKGAQLVVEAMLQSPNFLFWNDTTPDPTLKPYAAASRLSYSLWDTMPDAALFAAAEHGELSTAAGLEKQARRMLADPKAHDSLDEFVSQWLRFDRLLTASKDRRKFPYFTRETATAMTTEARTFVSDLVWNDGDFMTLFTADYGYVSPELARIYGVTAPAKDFDKVPFPPNSERAGILGQGLFLAGTSKPEDSSPTARGLFIREQFLCQHVPDPPPGVNTNLPPVTEANPQTNRDRMAEHTSNTSCSTCHRLMDGVGFGLEKFDAIGAHRDELVLEFRIKKKGGDDEEEGVKGAKRVIRLPLNTQAYVAGIPNSDFTSPLQLGAVLAKSGQCQECVVKQYFRFEAGRTDTASDRPLIHMVSENFRNSGFKFKELIMSLMVLREFPNAESLQTALHPVTTSKATAPDKGNLQHVADNHRTR
jgi:mono/diheme cytochrome c family protein